jgi:hypothetical protein
MVESTAAAMAYGLLVVGTKNVLIFDMGGGTSTLNRPIYVSSHYLTSKLYASSEYSASTLYRAIL